MIFMTHRFDNSNLIAVFTCEAVLKNIPAMWGGDGTVNTFIAIKNVFSDT